MKPTIIDIGANTGHAVIDLAKEKPNVQCYVFEPVPCLFEKLIENTKDVPNIVLCNKAVSNFNGKAQFNISSEDDIYSISSLLNLSDNIQINWSQVIQKIKHTEKIEVDVTTMESFVTTFGIKQIDMLHCDAQGSDLNVLKGFGSKISIVYEGKVEAAIKYQALYKNQCMIDQVVSFLNDNNFEILKITNNDDFGNEANVYFRNRDLSKFDFSYRDVK